MSRWSLVASSLVASSLVTIAAMLAACASERPADPGFEKDPRYASAGAATRDPSKALEALHRYRDYAAQQIGRADAVFVGEVLAVGVPAATGDPGALPTQPVLYRVEEVLRGWAPRRELVVHHVVLGGAPADGDGAASLDPALYRVGARLVVTAVLEDARGGAVGDLRYADPGIAGLPAPATKEIVAEIQRLKR